MSATSVRRQKRDDHLSSIPWISPVTEVIPCQGIKWGQVALKHLYSMGGRPAEGIPDKARCSRRAKWHFEALPDSDSTTGDYCFSHLVAQFEDPDNLEEGRYQHWLAMQPS